MKWNYVYDGKFPKSMFNRRYIYTIYDIVKIYILVILFFTFIRLIKS